MQPNALEMLTAMNEAQTRQMVAASLLAIAVCMKKAGLEEISIGPDDFKILKQGETLEPIPNVGGGFTYRFKTAPLVLAKLETPAKQSVAPKSQTKRRTKK